MPQYYKVDAELFFSNIEIFWAMGGVNQRWLVQKYLALFYFQDI